MRSEWAIRCENRAKRKLSYNLNPGFTSTTPRTTRTGRSRISLNFGLALIGGNAANDTSDRPPLTTRPRCNSKLPDHAATLKRRPSSVQPGKVVAECWFPGAIPREGIKPVCNPPLALRPAKVPPVKRSGHLFAPFWHGDVNVGKVHYMGRTPEGSGSVVSHHWCSVTEAPTVIGFSFTESLLFPLARILPDELLDHLAAFGAAIDSVECRVNILPNT
jgi:hypothetical protein